MTNKNTEDVRSLARWAEFYNVWSSTLYYKKKKLVENGILPYYQRFFHRKEIELYFLNKDVRTVIRENKKND